MLGIDYKVGLICVGLEGERNDLAAEFRSRAAAELKKHGLEVVNPEDGYTLSSEAVQKQTDECVNSGAVALVYLIGTWVLANHVVDSIMDVSVPFAIWGIPEPASFSSVGANVLHGALDEMGISHKLVYGWPEDKDVIEDISNFVSAAAIKKKLQKSRMGLFGGRTISAYPTTADHNQIKKLFGIEVEHFDQLLLLEKARQVPVETCDEIIAGMKQRYASVNVPHDMLQRTVSVYVALKELVREYNLDMVSVKCIGEFMDKYASCCLATSMLNDEGVVSTCQCDVNATISAYILSNLTKQPVFFGDVNTVSKEERVARVINCGSIPMKLAERPDSVKIVEQYEYMGAGRGACTFFCCKPGKVTFGSLGRVNGEYVMNIATGTAYTESEETMEQVRTWAQGFIKLDCDPMAFYRNIRSNHSVMCYGDVKDILLELCRLYGIKPESCTQ